MSGVGKAKKIIAVAMTLMVSCSMMMLGGCAGETGSRDLPLEPLISSPAIITEGSLTVGVDSSQPPYAGLSDGELVGIDVDVAAALAEQLGLKLVLVDTSGQSADTLLAEGSIDMVMDVEQTGGSVIQGTKVGPYIEGGPALFTTVLSDEVPTVDIASLAGTKIAAQSDSLSAWSLEELVGSGTADPRESLAAAFDAVANGEVSYAAADAVVGSYLAVEYDGLSCVKMLGTPIGVYIGVSESNTELVDALTDALRSIRDNGELKTVLSKWLGSISASVVMGESAIVSETTGATGDETTDDSAVDTGEDLPDPANAGGV